MSPEVWTVTDWFLMIGGITGYAILLVYVFVLKHNMPDQWKKIAEIEKSCQEKLDGMNERVHHVEKKVTRELGIRDAEEKWKVRDKRGEKQG